LDRPTILILILLALGLYPPLATGNDSDIPKDITQLFPSASHIEVTNESAAITAVYNQQQLLGYVFESNDFTHIQGYSGKPINMLIALDPQGVLVNLLVLSHHEPLFLHGIGEEPMITFIGQYHGHSIKERVTIGHLSEYINSDGIHFDGITKATVSAIVINDTIISSALKVARTMISEFSDVNDRVLKDIAFEHLTFDQLLNDGYIFHWQVSEQEALQQHQPLSTTIEKLRGSPGQELIDIYAAFLDISLIGRNLLGDIQYQRLMAELKPTEHALIIFNRGQYSYLRDDFMAQSMTGRLKIIQNELPISLLDIDFYNFYEEEFTFDSANFNHIKIFKIKSKLGFEISEPFTTTLSMHYQHSFMATKKHWFSQIHQLPDSLFEPVVLNDADVKRPLWQTLWLARKIEIFCLITYLLLVITLFINPSRWANDNKKMKLARTISLVFCVLFIGFYAQGQLSVVNIYTLLLSFVDGFNLTLFLLDPMLFILWFVVFISLFLWGRGLFCGWLCPFGALQDLITLVAKKLSIRQLKIIPNHHQMARYVKYVLLIAIVCSAFYSLSVAEKIAEVEPFKTSMTLVFDRSWPFVLYAVLILLASLKVHKFYCRYLCPLGAGLALVGRFPIIKWIRRRPECGSPCQLCSNKACGVKAINNNGAIDYGECIGCFECVVVIEAPKLCVINKYAHHQR